MLRFPGMPLCISIPAPTGALFILRTMVLTAGAELDLSVDTLDDLALAVHEVAVQLVERGANRLDMGAAPVPGGLRVMVGGDVALDSWPDPGWEHTPAGRIVCGLTGSVEHGADSIGSFAALAAAGGPAR
jgi:hypothetical protein